MSCNNIITITRQYGSGGHNIGKALSERLGIPFYDKELISLAAKESGISPEVFENVDEKATNSLLYSLSLGLYNYGNGFSSMGDLPVNDKLYILQHKIIKQLANEGPCVFVGRCADYVLRNQERVLRCYLYAPDAYRASSVASLNLSTASEYQPLIDEVDKARASYYLKYTGYPVDNLELRDLVVNTACLGLEGTVEMLAAFAAKKFGLNLEEQA